MATIKTTVDETNVRRVITKLIDEERKVSCACCTPTVCCMYPADQLGVSYTAADLPDTIEWDLSFDETPGINIVTLSRNGDQYGPYTANGVSTYLLVELNPFLEPSWHFFSTDGDPDFDVYSEYEPCLFSPPSPDLNSQRIEDTFEDTYEVSGPVSGTVTRQSICVWTGDGLSLSNFGYQWKVNGRNKSGNQNTPVGSYADGYSVAL